MAQKKIEKKSIDPSAEAKSVEIKAVEKPMIIEKKSSSNKSPAKTESMIIDNKNQMVDPESVVVEKKTTASKKSDHGSILLGAGLLFFGILLLAGRFLNISFGQVLLPFIFIVPGALVFLTAVSSESESGEGLSILGGILTSLGLVFLMQSITGLWATWAYIWALIAPTSIGISQMAYGNIKGRDTIAASGWRLTKIGLTILAIGFVFFELIIGISGFGLGRLGLPVFPMILIFFGAFMLVRSFLENR